MHACAVCATRSLLQDQLLGHLRCLGFAFDSVDQLFLSQPTPVDNELKMMAAAMAYFQASSLGHAPHRMRAAVVRVKECRQRQKCVFHAYRASRFNLGLQVCTLGIECRPCGQKRLCRPPSSFLPLACACSTACAYPSPPPPYLRLFPGARLQVMHKRVVDAVPLLIRSRLRRLSAPGSMVLALKQRLLGAGGAAQDPAVAPAGEPWRHWY